LEWWGSVVGAVVLVAFAGLMSGLTIGLLSLSPVDLEVIMRSSDAEESAMAKEVQELTRDQHRLLVTLLICNAAAMEGLPILLDDIMHPLAAVMLSVTVVLVFGEIVPQAICKAFGIKVGATAAPMVRILLTLCYPLAAPIATILDTMFGHERGSFYRRNEMSSLFKIEKEQGELSENEASVMEGALEMAHKRCSSCLRSMSTVHSLSEEAVLDEATMDWMLSTGRSRIPVHRAGAPSNLLGVVLLKKLVKLRPEDATPVSSLNLSLLLHTSEETKLYDVLEVFQAGYSHMAAIYDKSVQFQGAVQLEPPGNAVALGILTMEDVIEELIKSQISDECEVISESGESSGSEAVFSDAKLVDVPAGSANLAPSMLRLPRKKQKRGLVQVLRTVSELSPLPQTPRPPAR